MQMTFDGPLRLGQVQAFALRQNSGYVMRSEKRQGYGGASGSGKRPPRRKKAGALYIIFTLLISLILWPVGMVMLWRRKVRMEVGTKLLLSLLTLCLSIFLIVFALTVHVEDERITAVQDRANDWLDKTYASIAVAGDAAYHKGVETWELMVYFRDRTQDAALFRLADTLDKGVETATAARDTVMGWFTSGKKGMVDAEPTAAPEPTKPGKAETVEIYLPADAPEASSAKALSGGMLISDGGFIPDGTPEALPTAAPKATAEPAATAEADEAEETAEPVETENTPEVAESANTVEDEATTAPTDAPTAELTPHTLTRTVKPAIEARVYYYDVGLQYHMTPTCSGMADAPAHTLSEAVSAGKQSCGACGSPDSAILTETYIVWVDDANVYHTTDECERFSGEWRLLPLTEAIASGLTACPDCQADLYAEKYGAIAQTMKPTAAPTAEPTVIPTAEPTAVPTEEPTAAPTAKPTAEPTAVPTEKPTPVPTAEPTPVPTVEPTPVPTAEPTAVPTIEPTVIVPTVTLKPAGDARVYHSSNGKYYHKTQICKAMTGSSPYKLSEVIDSYKRCKTCNAPLAELVGVDCLWMDENGLCHTSDECSLFKGSYTLIPRDEALAQGKLGCTDCGANEYLVPNSTLGE